MKRRRRTDRTRTNNSFHAFTPLLHHRSLARPSSAAPTITSRPSSPVSSPTTLRRLPSSTTTRRRFDFCTTLPNKKKKKKKRKRKRKKKKKKKRKKRIMMNDLCVLFRPNPPPANSRESKKKWLPQTFYCNPPNALHLLLPLNWSSGYPLAHPRRPEHRGRLEEPSGHLLQVPPQVNSSSSKNPVPENRPLTAHLPERKKREKIVESYLSYRPFTILLGRVASLGNSTSQLSPPTPLFFSSFFLF